MAITNISKPSAPSFTNTTRVNIGETWGSDMNTWSAESRTWADTASVIDNISKVSSSLTNISKPA